MHLRRMVLGAAGRAKLPVVVQVTCTGVIEMATVGNVSSSAHESRTKIDFLP